MKKKWNQFKNPMNKKHILECFIWLNKIKMYLEGIEEFEKLEPYEEFEELEKI